MSWPYQSSLEKFRTHLEFGLASLVYLKGQEEKARKKITSQGFYNKLKLLTKKLWFDFSFLLLLSPPQTDCNIVIFLF